MFHRQMDTGVMQLCTQCAKASTDAADAHPEWALHCRGDQGILFAFDILIHCILFWRCSSVTSCGITLSILGFCVRECVQPNNACNKDVLEHLQAI